MNLKLQEKLKCSKGLLFDMDGVVTDTMPRHAKAWRTAFKKVAKIDVPVSEIYKREGEKSEKSVREILSAHSLETDGLTVKNILDLKAEIFTGKKTLKFYSGMKNFIKLLSKTKMLALVTGTRKIEISRLMDASVRSCFRVVVTSDDITRGKPDPEPYRKALSLMNLAPRECLAVENAPYGIESARSAGLKVLALATTLPVKELAEADYICRTHAELFAHIQPRSRETR